VDEAKESRSVYAIIRTGGKQYRVQPGEVVRFERLAGDVGAKVSLGEVLFVGGEGTPRVGSPHLEGVSVTGTVVEQDRAGKIRVFKFKKRKHYRRTRGHRQSYTAVRIESVEG
jgi:large subunit ribosomal protein L21